MTVVACASVLRRQFVVAEVTFYLPCKRNIPHKKVIECAFLKNDLPLPGLMKMGGAAFAAVMVA